MTPSGPVFRIIDSILEHPKKKGEKKGKLGPASICLTVRHKGRAEVHSILGGDEPSEPREGEKRGKHRVQSANRVLGRVGPFVTNMGAHAALLWKTQIPHSRERVKGKEG